MKTRINLYPEHLKPKTQLLNLSFVMIVWLVIGLNAVFFYYDYNTQYKQTMATVNKLQVSLNNLENQREKFEFEVSERKQSPRLLREVIDLKEQLKIKRRLQTSLLKQENFKLNGFSQLMSDLARHHHDDMWLTEINVYGEVTRFVGVTLQSAAVPEWLDNLSSSEFFSGQTFSQTKLYRDTDGQLNFILSSKPNQKDTGRRAQ